MDRKIKDILENFVKYVRHPYIFNDLTARAIEKTKGEGFYHKETIDLSVAHTDQEYVFDGDYISIESVASDVTLKLNSTKNKTIDLTKYSEIYGPFKKFYITNSALSGNLVLNIGTKGMFKLKKQNKDYIPVHKDDQQATAQTDTVLWNPTSGKKFVMTDLMISVDTAMTVHIEDGATTIYEWYLAQNGGVVINLKTPYHSVLADNNLTYTSSALGKISITVEGYEE